MAQQVPQLHDLPAFLLARVVRSLAVSDPRAAVSLACTCRLLAAVSADELLVFAPLCRELQKLQPATPCGGASGVRRRPGRPHACAYVALRLASWLTSNLWRGAGDDAGRRFAFFWKADGGTVECAELDSTCTARLVGTCRVGSGGDARGRDSDGALDVLRLDAERCVLSLPPEQPAVSAMASAIVGTCTSPVGSPSSNFALAYLEHTHTLVKSSRRRRTGQQAGLDLALLRVAPLAQVSLALGDARPHIDTAASALDIATGATLVHCVKHEACVLTLFWLRGGRLLTCCTHGGAAPREVCHIAPQ